MEKRRKTNRANTMEIQLPEALIQHMQSYLDGKQAAQTCVLSKSWYSAWLTRPNLDFDHQNFEKLDEGKWKSSSQAQAAGEFLGYVGKTMKRYEDSNRKIESFRLCMENTDPKSVSFVDELIVKALKMGANDLDIIFPCKSYVLPYELLRAKSLVKLRVTGCKIDPPGDRKVICVGLRCLSLRNVYIGEDTLRDIVSSCPLIENLSLSYCWCLVKVNGAALQSKQLCFRDPLIEIKKRNVGHVVYCSIDLSEICKLNYLLLEGVYLDSSFFHGFSDKLPCLEELNLRNCHYFKAIQISSRSLKRIRLEDTRMVRVKFDVPSIRKFSYRGSKVPSVSFKSSSSEWESDVSIVSWCNKRYYPPCASWLLELERFLLKLRGSRISLKLPTLPSPIHSEYMEEHIDYVKAVERLPKPMLENLMLSTYDPCPLLLDALFLTCCPMIISVTWSPEDFISSEEGNNKLLETFWKLLQQVGKTFRIPERNMPRLRDLEKESVELADENYDGWRSIPWKAWLDTPEAPEYRRRMRLQFRLHNGSSV